jgi:cytochrome c553
MSQIDSEILQRVSRLEGQQKNEVLNYLRNLKGERHSTKRHRRNAMKQIRQALTQQGSGY